MGEQVDHRRRQVLDAATPEPLREASGYSALPPSTPSPSRARVARGTVYSQFGSKTGLLEVVCDDLGRSGRLDELAQVFADLDPADALACFGRFWQADRI